MKLALNLSKFNIDHVLFNTKIRNNVMEGDFNRIYYSDEISNFNGIMLLFKLNDVVCNKYFAKNKLTYNRTDRHNIGMVSLLKSIELQILEKFNSRGKKSVFHITDQLNNHFIKFLGDDYDSTKYSELYFKLKISGIWENSNEFGLTFRFYKI